MKTIRICVLLVILFYISPSDFALGDNYLWWKETDIGKRMGALLNVLFMRVLIRYRNNPVLYRNIGYRTPVLNYIPSSATKLTQENIVFF